MTSILKYEEKSINLINRFLNNEIDKRELLIMHHNLYYEIEEMHKQEIIDAYDEGELSVVKNAEQYYQETFVSKGSDDHIADIGKMELNK